MPATAHRLLQRVAHLRISPTQTRAVAHEFEVRQTEVDVIPFGEIEAADRTITWSSDHRMDVFGFREAFAAAIRVTLPGNLEVAVASLAAQSIRVMPST
jgi:predicted nucleotidyltransferase